MTRLEEGSAASEAKTEAERQHYFIDLKWYESSGRLFPIFVGGRMCSSCRRKLEVERERQEEPNTRSRSRDAKQRSSADPLTAIQSCCSKADDFITPKLPILEAVFRLLLAKGSPMDAVQIRESLNSWPGVAGAYSHISAEMLEHLLESDNFYGFRPSHPENEGQ